MAASSPLVIPSLFHVTINRHVLANPPTVFPSTYYISLGSCVLIALYLYYIHYTGIECITEIIEKHNYQLSDYNNI